jgi:hypothetical protein
VLATTATSSRTKAGCNACPVAASADDAEGADNEELEVEEAEEGLLEVEALSLRIILDDGAKKRQNFIRRRTTRASIASRPHNQTLLKVNISCPHKAQLRFGYACTNCKKFFGCVAVTLF